MPNEKLFWYDPNLPDADEVYRHIATSKWCEGDREHLEALWSQYSALGLADPEFLDRFPKEFPARVWEMRLACLLAGWTLRLVPSPKRGAGLDFGISLKNGRVAWVEATAPSPGDPLKPDSVSVPVGQFFHGAPGRTRHRRFPGRSAPPAIRSPASRSCRWRRCRGRRR